MWLRLLLATAIPERRCWGWVGQWAGDDGIRDFLLKKFAYEAASLKTAVLYDPSVALHLGSEDVVPETGPEKGVYETAARFTRVTEAMSRVGSENLELINLKPITWKSTDPGAARRAVEEALRAGYLHVDCASVYDNEDEVGDGMAEVFMTTKLRRRDVFVTSKLWNDAHAPNDVEPACRASLARLRVGYLDLYLMHWPVADKVKDKVSDKVEPPLLDTWRAMERLVDLGLVRHIGVSNFSAKKLQSLVENARHPVSVCQVECHPYWRQDRLLAYCEENNIHFTAYSPLGSPDSAAMFRGRNEVPAVMQDPVVRAVAERAGRNVGQVLLRWALQTRPKCSVLPKSANPERLRSNLDVFDWCLPEEDVRLIDAVAPRHRMVDGSFWLSPKGPYKTLEDLWDE